MKYLKRLLSKRNNAGFTLLEVVISVALLGILVLSMTFFVTPVLRAADESKGDIRATVLAETVDSYLNKCLTNADRVNVFTGVATKSYNETQRNNDLQKIYDSELEEIFNRVKENSSYEVRCIIIGWNEDLRTHEHKYMLSIAKLEVGAGDKYTIKEPTNKIFEDCFYDGLFPEITIEQVYAKDGKEDPSGTPAPVLKLSIDVYGDEEETDLTASGKGYTDLVNIRNAADGAKNNVKIKPVRTPNSDEAHTDTYIFYCIRKGL